APLARLGTGKAGPDRTRGVPLAGGRVGEHQEQWPGRRPDVTPAVGRGGERRRVAEQPADPARGEPELVGPVRLPVHVAVRVVGGGGRAPRGPAREPGPSPPGRSTPRRFETTSPPGRGRPPAPPGRRPAGSAPPRRPPPAARIPRPPGDEPPGVVLRTRRM